MCWPNVTKKPATYVRRRNLLELVVHMDRKYQLPKLEENIQRLAALRASLAGQGGTPPHRKMHV
ncbi:hypothetical protein EMGBD2_18670 [Nitrospirota bacterium]|nr:hypothetical protein EMGBD2_18670 [Nitrospirota bacterium]